MGIEPTQGKTGSPTATGADATHPIWVALADGVVGALLKAYDAAVAASSLVLRVQGLDATGKARPAGEVATNAPFTRLSDGAAALGTAANPLDTRNQSSAPVLVGEDDTSTADATPTLIGDGHLLPTTGAKETIVLQFVVTAAAAGTLTGTIFVWQSLGVTPGWYPLRQVTVGNLAAIEADADQLLGAVVEISWPKGVTAVAWECTDETGTATGHYVITA